jgi:hypothetical protein
VFVMDRKAVLGPGEGEQGPGDRVSSGFWEIILGVTRQMTQVELVLGISLDGTRELDLLSTVLLCVHHHRAELPQAQVLPVPWTQWRPWLCLLQETLK